MNMSFFARRALVQSARQAPQRRAFGAHSAEAAADEMNKWKKIFFMVGIPVCVIKGGSDLVMHHEHHEDDSPKPDYMKIRNKEYSWECGDCAYFDMKCWKACRAEKA